MYETNDIESGSYIAYSKPFFFEKKKIDQVTLDVQLDKNLFMGIFELFLFFLNEIRYLLYIHFSGSKLRLYWKNSKQFKRVFLRLFEINILFYFFVHIYCAL